MSITTEWNNHICMSAELVYLFLACSFVCGLGKIPLVGLVRDFLLASSDTTDWNGNASYSYFLIFFVHYLFVTLYTEPSRAIRLFLRSRCQGKVPLADSARLPSFGITRYFPCQWGMWLSFNLKRQLDNDIFNEDKMFACTRCWDTGANMMMLPKRLWIMLLKRACNKIIVVTK
jgi:hypothetical protein